MVTKTLVNGHSVTAKEAELFPLLCLPYKVISERTGMDSGAVSMGVTRLLAKFEVENRMALIVKLLRLGLVNIDQLVYREF